MSCVFPTQMKMHRTNLTLSKTRPRFTPKTSVAHQFESFLSHRSPHTSYCTENMNFLQTTEQDVYDAAVRGDNDAVEALLKSKPDVNLDYQYDDKYSALMIACEKGDVEIARTLLKAGANINTTSKTFGSTALSRASEFGHTELVLYLLKGGFTADVNIQSKRGWTALMQAAFNGHVEVVRWLLTCPDINISLKDETGKTALEHAKTDELKTMIGLAYESAKSESNHSSTKSEQLSLNTERLQELQVRFYQLEKHVRGVSHRAEWIERRDELEASLRTAEAAHNFTLCAKIGRQLETHEEVSAQLVPSEEDFLSLSARRGALQSDLQAFCKDLVAGKEFALLEKAAALLESVEKLDPQALAVTEEGAAAAGLVPESAAPQSQTGEPAAPITATVDKVIAGTDVSKNELEGKILSMQSTINVLMSDLAQRDAKIDALSAELSKIRASPITWIDDGSLDGAETRPKVAHRDSFIAEDYRWL